MEISSVEIGESYKWNGKGNAIQWLCRADATWRGQVTPLCRGYDSQTGASSELGWSRDSSGWEVGTGQGGRFSWPREGMGFRHGC